jgi:membrane protease subunit HflC
VLVAALAAAAPFSVVVLDEREQAFRTFLNDPEFRVLGVSIGGSAVLTQPGWYVALPGLHQLYRYERRLLRQDAQPADLYTADKQPLELDYYALWRIDDPRRFFESVRSYDDAARRIDTVTYGEVRKVVAQSSLGELLSPRRTELVREIASRCDQTLQPLGIRVLDLRVLRTDYAPGNLDRVYERMRSERQRFARRFRAEGEEQARVVRAEADRESAVLRAEARGESERIRGEGDASAAGIYAAAYGVDPEFYAFVRSLEAYRLSLDERTTVVLSRKNPFLRFLFEPPAGARAPAAPATP